MKRDLYRLFFLAALLTASMGMWAQDPWVVQTASPLEGTYYGITSANGQIGLVSSQQPLTVDKVIVGGLYDACGKGGVDNFFANIQPLTVALTINGSPVTTENISHYTQSFDFRDATFHGQFDVAHQAHVDYTIFALRQMPFGYMMDVRVRAKQAMDIQVSNTHTLPALLQGMQTHFGKVKNKSRSGAEQQVNYWQMTTKALSPTGRWQVAASTAYLFPDVPNGGVEVPIQHTVDSLQLHQSQSFEQSLAPGQTLHFAVVGSVLGSNMAADVMNEVERLTIYELLEGYERLLQRHRAAWQQLWQSDIIVEGAAQDQQDIHNMLYHLYAFNREGSGLSCSPMGVSGQGYHGHFFWDSETWMFPALVVMQPQLAAEMLDYRFQRLEAARRNAYLHGYQGAMFPWESAYTGEEETPLPNIYSEAEIHLSADVAIACWQYYQRTGDRQWLAQKGWPILQATAEFWTSRVEWDKQGRAHLNNVIGADEWTCNPYGGKNVNDNAYTNGAAITNLRYAIRAAQVLGITPPPTWQQTADGIRFDYLDNGVTAEHDTYQGQPIKQADVILLAYPLQLVTDTAQIRRDLAYYSAKTPDKKTPAMSKSIYAILYNRLGDQEKALHYFRETFEPNLTPPFRLMAEFNGGTNPYFITGAGGILQSLIFGFGGWELTDQGLQQTRSSSLPKEWKSLTIHTIGIQQEF